MRKERKSLIHGFSSVKLERREQKLDSRASSQASIRSSCSEFAASFKTTVEVFRKADGIAIVSFYQSCPTSYSQSPQWDSTKIWRSHDSFPLKSVKASLKRIDSPWQTVLLAGTFSYTAYQELGGLRGEFPES